MNCPHCGNKIPTNSNFCTECGRKLSESEKSNTKTSRHLVLKILGIIAGIFIVFMIIGMISYIFQASDTTIYKHPTIGFSIPQPKSLNIETPALALPKGAKCEKAAPCFVVFKNPAYDNYITNWFIALSSADMGAKPDVFLAGAAKGFQEDLNTGAATTMTISGKTVYKYENNPNQPNNSLATFSKMMGFDPALEKTMYAFISGENVVVIFFRKPPSGAPSNYKDYLNISSLIIP